MYAPVDGEVIENNSALEDQPELVNEDPYGEGWMLKIKVQDASQLENLMDVASYKSYVQE